MKQILVFICIGALSNCNATTAQTVNTTLGIVKGISLVSREGREFTGFLGIPYAKPPLGDLRFKAPQPHEGWNGVRNSSEYGHMCPQYPHPPEPGKNYTGNEDCLTINVFTSNIPTSGKKTASLLPVLVNIHGGYFMCLSGSTFGPFYFMDENLVLVTFNYRLGAIGFLSTEDDNAPGNAGMKDQVMALKWVQDNIHFFGGDPSRVTIYGESAGGAAVHYHLLSPMSRGLFSAAISGSGSAFKINSYQVSPLEAANTLARRVGCEDSIGNNTKMIECLREVDASLIGSAGDEYDKPLKNPFKMFSPSSEPNTTNILSEEPFFTGHPYLAQINGDQQKVPWITGVNSGEGLIVSFLITLDEELIKNVNANWTDHLAKQFLIYDDINFPNFTKSLNDFYLSTATEDGKVDFMQDLPGFTHALSDRLYIHPSLEALRIQATKSPVLFYYNDYNTVISPIPGIGVDHAEEMTLLFSPKNWSEPIIDKIHPDYTQSKILVSLWMQFINDPFNVSYSGKLWTPVNTTDKDVNCLVLRNSEKGEQGMSTLPKNIIRRRNFWNDQKVPPYAIFLI